MGLASRDQWPEGSFVGQLPEAERAALLAAGANVRFDDDAILLLQGEVGECVYVLTGGLAKVIVAAESGAETTLAIRSRGDLMGEFALLDDKPRTATARAVGEVTALKIGGSAFMQLTGESAAMQAAVTRYLLSKMRSTTERRAAERVWDAKERLAQVPMT
jgi:CRP-like cAMP-binding protein